MTDLSLVLCQLSIVARGSRMRSGGVEEQLKTEN
jgi:hypothetical protein